MYIHQIYTNCLAQAAYYIESDREAAIIDPLRDPQPYIELATSRGATIKYIFETHFHADFVSGHLDLSRATGAAIVFGPDAQPAYPAYIARDKEHLRLGKCEIEVLHTPGHTIESSCFLLRDEKGNAHALFSGDTLFAGDVGRPDLLSGNLDAATLASKLYDSIQHNIKTLADDVIVYPGHGAGSACGKNIGKETKTTIGEQKKSNYALQDMTREKFIELVTTGQPVPPQYFFSDAKMNKTGYDSFFSVMKHARHRLAPEEVDRMKREGTIVLDTRSPEVFGKGHVPGSVNIGLDGDFAIWAGTLYPASTEFILVTDAEREQESITRLARIGFDNIRGVLDGGMDAWLKSGRPADHIESITPEKLRELQATGKYVTLDVRRKAESEQRKLKNSVHFTLSEIPKNINRLNRNERYLVCCAGGYRSMIAASLLKAAGIGEVFNVTGGVARVMQEEPELVEVMACS
ncbi:MAG: MBL fold metallo-hydrolase [Bacteroidia bacterium]